MSTLRLVAFRLTSRTPWLAAARLAIALLVLGGGAPAKAQVVELNPVELTGSIQIGDYRIGRLQVTAISNIGRSTTPQFEPDAVVASYSTIVQVPVGGGANYRLSIYAQLFSADGSQYVQFQYEQTSGSVFVRDGEPAVLDLILDPPSRLAVTVTADPGELVESATLNMRNYDSGQFGAFYTQVQAPPGGVQTLSFEMPVGPDMRMLCRGFAQLTNGRGAELEPLTLVSVAPGAVEHCDFGVEPPPLLGSISGKIDYEGPVPVDEYTIYATRQPGGGGESQQQTLLPPFGGTGNEAPYLFENVVEGDYKVGSLLSLNEGEDQISVSLSDRFSVGGGPVVIGGGSLCQAFVDLDLSFGGRSSPEDFSFDGTPVSLAKVTSELLASSVSRADPLQGPFRMLAMEGRWQPVTSFSVHRSFGVRTNTSVSAFRLPAFDLACGETLALAPVLVETGHIEIRFRVATGAYLRVPIIQGSCMLRDAANGETLYDYNLTAYSFSSSSVPVGIVPVEAPAGICTFLASAEVAGSRVSFGSLNDVEIVPGVDVVLGLGGPRIAILSPTPGAVVDAEEILVAGTATDDGSVRSVVVNGVPADLVPTGNPDDPNEVAFSAFVPIESGANRITAVATDDDDNESEASLTIENVMPPPPNDPPSLRITSPAPGTAFETNAIRVEGLASDDVGVQSVVLNGFPAQLTPTGNPDDPNEVAFAAQIYLYLGTNPLTATARDERGESTAVAIEVEYAPPPLPCDVNGDFLIDSRDIGMIFAARGSAASGPGDPRDVNGDGLVTINDGRLCVLQCTYPRCASDDD